MPSFLNKVFGHKKHDDRDLARPPRDTPDGAVLLDGKYEVVPPASAFADSDRDLGFSLFRLKSRALSQKTGQRLPGVVPHLTLRLPGTKDNSDAQALGIVFDVDPDAQLTLDDATIADKRLHPLDALVLIRACAQAITERGVETLGVMHPHWLSASPDVQRKLISLFIRSLTPPTRTTTLPSSPTFSAPTFDSKDLCTHSPHDVAAVLRWGLRHLTLENGHFGKDGAEWEWYRAFFLAERRASYPPKAFSELLLPRLPPSHIELLTVTLGLISSLASHAETNSISGSKLSKFLGIWLLVATRTEESDDWSQFYARWERAGRILEHLFLARLREESLRSRLPTRLQELVQHYPYNKSSPTTDDDLLPRPRFTTRRYDALCVRVETVLTPNADQPKQHPVQLLLDAFQLAVDNPSEDVHMASWSTLKTLAFEGAPSSYPEGPQFARIFVDETVQLLSLIPAGSSVASPTLVTSPTSKAVSRRRSSSLPKVIERASSWSNTDTPVSPTSPSSAVITDWAQFSLTGFGGAPTTQPLVTALSQDEDTEVTQPQISRKSSQRRGKSRSRSGRSGERGPRDTQSHGPEPSVVETRLASVRVVQIDEAFIDFWSDAVVDPISADWPTFVLCGLKDVPSTEPSIRWLVIEQAYSRQQPQSSRNPSPDGRRGRSPRPSFKSDISGFRINSVFSSARKRFSLFSKSATDLDPKKSGGKTATTGEFGEVLVEEEIAFPAGPSANVDQHVDGSVVLGAAIASGVTADIADQLNANAVHTAPILSTDPASVHKEVSDLVGVTTKAPSAEPTPLSGGGDNTRLHPFVEQGSPETVGLVGPNVDNAPGPLTRINSVAAATADPQPSDPTVHVMGVTTENLIAEDGRTEAEPLRQDIAGDTHPRPVNLVALPVDSDERLSAEHSAESSSVVQADVTKTSWEVAETVAMPSAPDRVTEVVEKPIAPSGVVEESATNDSRVPSREAPANVATSAAAPVGRHGTDDLPPLPATDVEHKTITPEARTQLEPNLTVSVTDVVDEAKGVAEPVEIPTPAPELVALVVETPGPEVYADAHEPTGTAQVPANVPEVFDGSVAQLTAADLQDILEVDELSIAHPAEDDPSVEIVPAVDTSAQVVPAEAEHAADQASDLPTEEPELSVQGAIVQATEALLVQDDASAGIVSPAMVSEGITPAEVGDHVVSGGLVVEVGIAGARDMGAPTPVLENPAPVDETPSPEVATEEHVPVETQPTAAPEYEVVEDKAVQSAPQATREGAGLSTEPVPLAEDGHPCTEAELSTQEPPSTASVLEDETAALATADEINVVAAKTEAQPILDLPTDDDPEARALVLENVPVADRPEIAVDARQRDPVESVPSVATAPESVQDAVEDEARVCVGDAAGSTNELVPTDQVAEAPVAAHDVQAPVGLEEPSVAQTVVHPPIDTAPTVVVADDVGGSDTPAAESESVNGGAPAPDVAETRFPLVEAEEAEVSVVVIEASEEDAASELSAWSIPTTVKVDETGGAVGSQEEVDVDDERSTAAPVDALAHELGEPSEEIAPAEPQDLAHDTA